ncbi:MAG: virulence factor TspB C-terminal domain-related protein [Pseudomonas sp.]
MRQGELPRIITALFVLLGVLFGGVSSAQAEIYYWVVSFPEPADTRYPSAVSACAANHQYYAAIHSASYEKLEHKTIKVSDTSFTCETLGFNRNPYSGQLEPYGRWSNSAQRRGDGCEGQNYNPQTGACEAPEPDQCESTIGDVVYHEFRFASLGSDGNPSADPPVTVCKGGCQYSHTFGDFSSKRDFGPPDQLVGSFEYKGNGTSCTPSANDPSVFDQPPAKDPVTKAPEYATSNDCSGWETQPDGTLKRNCTANTSYKDEGEVECKGGTAGSGFSSSVKCTPSKTKPPQKSETNVEQETTKKDNPDGSSETTTKTDTTKTECKGTKPCESTSKTETESENTDPDGNSNKNGNCVGDGCNPDKTDGTGTEGKEEGEQGEERTATVGTCDGGFSCTGDPIDCAILKQQKEQQCYAEEMSDFDGKKSEVEGLLQGENFELNEGGGDIDVPSFISQGTRFLSPSCPPDRTVSLSMAGRSVGFSFQPLCNFASGLGPFLVAVTAVYCALYVGRSVGGN